MIGGAVIVLALIIIVGMVWNDYLNGREKLWVPVALTGILIGLFALAIKEMIPYFRDLGDAKNKNFCELTGKVVRFRKRKDGGDVVTTEVRPIVAEQSTGKEVELKIDGLVLGNTYTLLYLRCTRYAVLKEDKPQDNNNDDISAA